MKDEGETDFAYLEMGYDGLNGESVPRVAQDERAGAASQNITIQRGPNASIADVDAVTVERVIAHEEINAEVATEPWSPILKLAHYVAATPFSNDADSVSALKRRAKVDIILFIGRVVAEF